MKSRCTKSLDLIKVLSNTTWGADRKVLLRLYRALIRSKLDYDCIVYGSARPSYIKQLDTVHNQGLRLCLGAFRTSPVQSLYVEANEPPLDMRRTRLSLQFGVKLMSNEVNPAYSAVFQSDIVATYEAKERAIKPLGLRIERHLDGVGFHTHVIAPYTVMKTPPWKLIIPTVCFDLCKYKKSNTDPTLYRLHYSELLQSFTDYTHIFTDGSKDGDKTAAAFICQSFEFSKRLPDKASIFTAELEAIVSALRYIKITTKNNKFVVFGDSKSVLQALLSKWDHPTVQTIMRFLVFLHTVHKTVFVGYPVIWEFLETNVLILFAALQKDISSCFISYTDTYQYISPYVRDMWQSKLHATKPLIGEQPSAYRSVRRDEVVLSRLRLGHSYLTHSYLLKGEPPRNVLRVTAT